MAYTKKLNTIVITTVGGGTFTITDTVECDAASQALASLQSGQGAYVLVGQDKYWIAPTGVAHIKVTTEDSEEITPSAIC